MREFFFEQKTQQILLRLKFLLLNNAIKEIDFCIFKGF